MDIKISAYRQSVRETPLKEGDIVNAVNVKHGKDGSYILTINGKNVEAVSKDLLFNPPLRLQIVKTSPLEVELLKQNSMQQFQVGDKVKKGEPLAKVYYRKAPRLQDFEDIFVIR